MELEDQKKIEMLKDDIICLKAQLIHLKNKKLSADKEYELEKTILQKNLKKRHQEIENLEDMDIDMWIEKENEKEIERLEKLELKERMKEELERIKDLQEAKKNNWYGEQS